MTDCLFIKHVVQSHHEECGNVNEEKLLEGQRAVKEEEEDGQEENRKRGG